VREEGEGNKGEGGELVVNFRKIKNGRGGGRKKKRNEPGKRGVN